MRREHLICGESTQPYELIWYFDYNNNLIERVSGLDMTGLTWSSRAGVEFVLDPTDNSRYVVKRPSATNLGLQPPYAKDSNTRYYLIPCGDDGVQTDTAIYLVGKTVEFLWYPKNNNDGNAYIFSNVDLGVGATSNNYGYDLLRNGNTLLVTAAWRNGSSQNVSTYNLGTFSTNKWYRVVIDYVDHDTYYRCHYSVVDVENGHVAIDSDIVQLPDITLLSPNHNDRIATMFNSCWSYYANWPNKTDYIKEFKVYRYL